MATKQVSLGPPAPAAARGRSRRARRDFVAKTITGVADAVERSVYAEEFARRPGWLQRVDPRAKIAAFVLAVLVVGLARALPVLVAVYLFAVLLGLLSRLPLSLFLKRVLLGIPLFSCIVALPALFILDGRVLLAIAHIGPLDLAVTDNSLASFAIFVTRVAASVTLATLLVVTTRWADLLKALRVLHVPEVFIVVLGMTYRYIFLLLRALENLFLARASRTVGHTASDEQRRWVGASMGTLLGKSFKTSNDVYQAMVARGFSGDVRTITDFRMRDEDWLFVSLACVLLPLALMIDLAVR